VRSGRRARPRRVASGPGAATGLRVRGTTGPVPRRGERGAATAELAVALPSLVIVLAVALGAVDLGLSQVRCVDAARLGARLLARGEPQGPALAEVRAAAPEGARVFVTTAGTRVTVVVTGDVPAALRPLGALPAPAASAHALLEGVP
jgi:Flp pilus assembly protein TadG